MSENDLSIEILITLHDKFGISLKDILIKILKSKSYSKKGIIFNAWAIIQTYVQRGQFDETMLDDLIPHVNINMMKYFCDVFSISDKQYATFALESVLCTDEISVALSKLLPISIKKTIGPIWRDIEKLRKVNPYELSLAIARGTWKTNKPFWEIIAEICTICKGIPYGNIRDLIVNHCGEHIEYFIDPKFKGTFDDKNTFNNDIFKLICENYKTVKYNFAVIKNANTIDKDYANMQFIMACEKGLELIVGNLVNLKDPKLVPVISIDTIDECFYNALVMRDSRITNVLSKYVNMHRYNHRAAHCCVEHNLIDFRHFICGYTFKLGTGIIISVNTNTNKYCIEMIKYEIYAKNKAFMIDNKDCQQDTCVTCMCNATPESRCIIKLPCEHTMCVLCYHNWYDKGNKAFKWTLIKIGMGSTIGTR
jgi:hypothetical protein